MPLDDFLNKKNEEVREREQSAKRKQLSDDEERRNFAMKADSISREIVQPALSKTIAAFRKNRMNADWKQEIDNFTAQSSQSISFDYHRNIIQLDVFPNFLTRQITMRFVKNHTKDNETFQFTIDEINEEVIEKYIEEYLNRIKV